jgi:hypothetical protein
MLRKLIIEEVQAVIKILVILKTKEETGLSKAV